MNLRGLGRAIGRRAGRGGEAVFGGDEHDRASALLPLHQPERLARHQKIAGCEYIHVLLPERQAGVLDR